MSSPIDIVVDSDEQPTTSHKAVDVDLDEEPTDFYIQPSGDDDWDTLLAAVMRQAADEVETVELGPLVPKNYLEWEKALRFPGQFFDNIARVGSQIRTLPHIAPYLEEVDGDLDRCLLRRRFPAISVEVENFLLASPEWPEIRDLLFLFEERFLSRIPGVVQLQDIASRHLHRGEPAVGAREHYGVVYMGDAEKFTEGTQKLGEAGMSHHLGSQFFGPSFETLEVYPEVRLQFLVGDAEVMTQHYMPDSSEQALWFLGTLADRIQIPAHLTAGFGHFSVILTPHGKLVVVGEALDRADAAQSLSKYRDEEEEASVFWVDTDGVSYAFKRGEYVSNRARPERSAVQFFKEVGPEDFERLYARQPAELLQFLRKEMAIVASPITKDAIRSKETVERSAISLYTKAPTNDSDPEDYARRIFEWEKMMEQRARKYDGIVRFITTSNDEKMAVVLFGAQGSGQINKEGRAARCANDIMAAFSGAQVGLCEGPIHISNMGNEGSSRAQEIISDAINKSQRLGSVMLAGMGGIRIDEATRQRFIDAGIQLVDENFCDVTLKSYGDVTVYAGDGFEIQTVNGYVREDKVDEIVTAVASVLDTDQPRRWSLQGEMGTGMVPAIITATRRLQSEHELPLVIMPRYAEGSQSYSGVCQALDSVFPGEGDFEAWLSKSSFSEAQCAVWRALYQELHAPLEQAIRLNRLEEARVELVELFRSLGADFGLTCPRWDLIDDRSRFIFLDSNIILLAIDCKEAEHTVEFGNVGFEEALRIANEAVGGEGVSRKSPLAKFIRERLGDSSSREALYNPLMVQIVAQEWQRGVMVGGDTRIPRLEHMVMHYADQITLTASRTLLGVALALGHFTASQLAMAAEPLLMNAGIYIIDLCRKGILKRSGSQLYFAQPYFADAARNVQELQLSPSQAVKIEDHVRLYGLQNGDFTFGHYLEVCDHLGVARSSHVIGTALFQSSRLLSQGRVLEAMDVGQQFLKIEMRPEDIAGFEVFDFQRLLRLRAQFIEAKMALGDSVKDDFVRVRQFWDAIPQRFKEELLEEDGQLKFLRTEAAYHSKVFEDHEPAVDALAAHYGDVESGSSEDLLVRAARAKFHYRVSGSSKLPRDERLAHIDEALGFLDETANLDHRRMVLQVRGQRLLSLGVDHTPDAIQAYIDDVRACLDDLKGEDDYKMRDARLELSLFLAMAYMMPANSPTDMEAGKAQARAIVEEASSYGYTGGMLKGLNFLMTGSQIQGEVLEASGDHRGAYQEYSEIEGVYREMSGLASGLTSQEHVAVTLVVSQLTWAVFGLAKQIDLLEYVETSDRVPRLRADLMQQLRKIVGEIKVAETLYPEAWPRCKAYVDYYWDRLEPLVGPF